MQSTPAIPSLVVSPQSLATAFAEVPDPRRAASVTYPLVAILTLAVSAILANHRSVLAMAEWGARQTPDHRRTLGFGDGPMPCQSTLQRLFCKLDGGRLAQTLTRCFAPVAVPDADAAPQGVAIDGKAQRGRFRFAPATGVVHALTAFCQESGIVLAHEPITRDRGQDRGRTDRRPDPPGAGGLAWPGPDRRCVVLPAQSLPAGPRGGRRLPVAGQGEPAGPPRGDHGPLRSAPDPRPAPGG